MTNSDLKLPLWVPLILKIAGVYNIVWGLLVIAFPSVPFGWIGLDAPNYPAIVQCLGMVIGVYGIGYWIAASDAATHWPIVLVGLLGKIFGPIGFVYYAFAGQLPWSMGLTILTNDIAWWWPFTAILIRAARFHEANRATTDGLTLKQALRSAVAQDGQNLLEQSFQSPLLVVCVRHFGCAFCREALTDLARQRNEIERAGLIPVVVSMGSNDQSLPVMKQFGLGDVSHVSDPQRRLYRALELPFGTLCQLFSGITMWRALIDGTVFRFGFGIGPMVGNGLQLSGAFVIKNGRIERAIRHATSSDRTDFAKFSCEVR